MNMRQNSMHLFWKNNFGCLLVVGVLDVLLVWALCRSRVFTAAGVWPTAAQPAQKGVSGQ